MLILGGIAVGVASFAGGATGFGFGLICTPLLLLVGYPLPFVVTSNLALSLVTRISVVYRLRAHVTASRVAVLIAGLIPGLVAGIWILGSVGTRALTIVAALVVVFSALLLARAVDAPPPRPLPGGRLAAGFLGGALGATTSLSGVAPALLLAREKSRPASFIADLAAYFVASCAILLGGLAASGEISTDALYPAFVVWLPVSLAGNALGVVAGTRLPERLFRRVVLAMLVVCGVIAALTA